MWEFYFFSLMLGCLVAVLISHRIRISNLRREVDDLERRIRYLEMVERQLPRW